MTPSYLPRILDLKAILEKKSLFLFGPRQTGKSSLLRHALSKAKVFNLLDHDVFLNLSSRPTRLREEITTQDKVIVIDEIQKLPLLLDEVHFLIEERGLRFLLTGSSARKLRRGGVNLLGGRARSMTLHPFVFQELPDFDLVRALNYGLLPFIYLSDSPEDDLRAYCGDYLQQEIAAEGFTRNIPAFSRFLEVAAACNSRMINFSEIANDAQVPRTTVHEYFQILRDTLIAQVVPPWKRSTKRKPITIAKFYFFDVGVARSLQHRGRLDLRSPELGEAFESFIFHELRTYADYHNAGEICYWRSKSGFEVDFVLADRTAIEVKAKRVVSDSDLRGLRALQEEKKLKHYVVVSLEERERRVGKIRVLPWKVFLGELWERRF